MQPGSSKDGSFSFQINDAVKDDDEYLLAEVDDFLQDVTDYTLSTPGQPSRTLTVGLEQHHPPAYTSNLTPRPERPGAAEAPETHAETARDADTLPSLLLPEQFTPSSPARSGVPPSEPHAKQEQETISAHEDTAPVRPAAAAPAPAAVGARRFRTPKPQFQIDPLKVTKLANLRLTTPKSSSHTISRRVSPRREIFLPRPEASPGVARLESLKAEIDMLAEDEDHSLGGPSNIQRLVQDEFISDRREESELMNPLQLNSNVPTPIKVESVAPIREEKEEGTMPDFGELDTDPNLHSSPLATRSTPIHEPPDLTSSSISICSCDDKNGNQVDSPDLSSLNDKAKSTPEELRVIDSRLLTGSTSRAEQYLPSTLEHPQPADRTKLEIASDQVAASPNITQSEAHDPYEPLTLSQLSPRKAAAVHEAKKHDPTFSSTLAGQMSPTRPPSKRPAPAVSSEEHDQQRSKKGKIAHSQENTKTTTVIKHTKAPVWHNNRTRAVTGSGKLAVGKEKQAAAGTSSGSRLVSSRVVASSLVSSTRMGVASSESRVGKGNTCVMGSRGGWRQSQRRVSNSRARVKAAVRRQQQQQAIAKSTREDEVDDTLQRSDPMAPPTSFSGSASGSNTQSVLGSSTSTTRFTMTSSSSEVHSTNDSSCTSQGSVEGAPRAIERLDATKAVEFDFKYPIPDGTSSRSGKDVDGLSGEQEEQEQGRDDRGQRGRMQASQSQNRVFRNTRANSGAKATTSSSSTTASSSLTPSMSTTTITTTKSTSLFTSNSNSNRNAQSRYMTRSMMRLSEYKFHRPIPDYKAQHAVLESSMARRKENIEPVIPYEVELHTESRAKERERFDEMVKEKEREMQEEREARRKEREEEEEREIRQLRKRAVPKANVVPEWYKDAPKRKR